MTPLRRPHMVIWTLIQILLLRDQRTTNLHRPRRWVRGRQKGHWYTLRWIKGRQKSHTVRRMQGRQHHTPRQARGHCRMSQKSFSPNYSKADSSVAFLVLVL